MKRMVLLVSVLLMLLTLTACDDSRVGAYHLQMMSMDGVEYDESTLEMLGFSATSLTLNDDSTCTFAAYGETAQGTWDDTTVILSGTTYSASWADGILTLSRENEEMRFTKA